MHILEKVKKSLGWKQSDFICSQRLNLSIEEYRELKKEVRAANHFDSNWKNKSRVIEFKEDLDKGTAEIKGLSSIEPKTPEEIIEILKIDTKKWKLSTYWNKERNDGWFISAMVTAIKHEPKDILAEVIANFKPQYQPVTEPIIQNTFIGDTIGIISTQDLHFGKENNDDIVGHFKEAVKNLVYRAYMSHKLSRIIYVVGGDLLNMDSFSGTTTSGTPVDNGMRAQDAYKSAFDALHWSISFIKQFCENLHVVYVPGNHDRLSSYHMAHALSKCFDTDEHNIYFDIEYSERKVVTYGNNFFAFEHGDVSKKNTALVYATEFPKSWGITKYRTCYTGHFHSKKTTEFVTENEHNGFSIKHLPSLCSTDYWHYHNKYVGSKRQAIMEIHDVAKGKVCEFTYTV